MSGLAFFWAGCATEVEGFGNTTGDTGAGGGAIGGTGGAAAGGQPTTSAGGSGAQGTGASSAGGAGTGGAGIECTAPEHACEGVCVGNTIETGCTQSTSCAPCAVPTNGVAACSAGGACDFSCNAGYVKSGTTCQCQEDCCTNADCASGDECNGGQCETPCNDGGCFAYCISTGCIGGACVSDACACLCP